MLIKILLTVLVIAGAWFLLVKRKRQIEPLAVNLSSKRFSEPLWRRYLLTGVFVVIGFSLLSYSVWYWRDQHRIVTVRIVSPNADNNGEYRVRKGDISDSKMVTIDGIHIRFSTQERLAIIETD
ncbi:MULTISPECIES: hypothetical protein [Shewanella]|uniref:Antitermination protein NusG n=1 Tax=Shewanella oncorhynchi TaxID=2726434 RepID=A0ABX1KPK5_9GAMM|nr:MULTISPECIES: hypothetical protein [Shewanella]MCU7962460.1 hypothetical protein [Shewanella sp. SW32]MCU7970354.1 hypothetical protein [Shewanella sp. SW29]MCU8011090.1 hypothetical protein [Shewanella sp. SM74]MCU8037867.1 hypothetical protein [Shewanella sp. SM69]MCU8068771.1 hypothetical protein [Shewanella sp. SM32]